MTNKTLASRSLRTAFEQQGYIVKKGLFTKDEINVLWENIKLSDVKGKTFGWDNNRLKFHTNLLSRNRKIQEFITQTKVINLLLPIIGENIWVRWDQAISKDPGASTMPWHQDNRSTQLSHAYYQVWIPLTQITADNGGLWIQPGNYFMNQEIFPHTYADGVFACSKILETPILIEAEPGDVVVFSSFLLHCTAPNITDQARWAYIVECFPLDCFDPLVEPPYFVMARDGKLHPEFRQFHPQRLNPINVFKYAWFKLKNVWYSLLKPWVRRVFNAKS
jgi:ectoine hydroxylase-related dioxygenase (phytanoyl-CoA dioxygenase family)